MILIADFQVIPPSISGMLFMLVFPLLLLVGLIDLITKNYRDNTERIFWLLAIVLTGGLATIFYLFRRKQIIQPSA